MGNKFTYFGKNGLFSQDFWPNKGNLYIRLFVFPYLDLPPYFSVPIIVNWNNDYGGLFQKYDLANSK